jgi:hypothetical protein
MATCIKNRPPESIDSSGISISSVKRSIIGQAALIAQSWAASMARKDLITERIEDTNMHGIFVSLNWNFNRD